jgi:hypothetical protein
MYDKGFRIAAVKLYNYIGNMKKTAKALSFHFKRTRVYLLK